MLKIILKETNHNNTKAIHCKKFHLLVILTIASISIAKLTRDNNNIIKIELERLLLILKVVLIDLKKS